MKDKEDLSKTSKNSPRNDKTHDDALNLSNQTSNVPDRMSLPVLSNLNPMSLEELTNRLHSHEEIISVVYGAMCNSQIFPSSIGEYWMNDLDEWEQNELLKKFGNIFCPISEQQLFNLVSSTVNTVNNFFSSINGVLEEYSKSCGVENITVEEAVSQVKSLLTSNSSICKFCQSLGQILYCGVPLSNIE